MEGLGKQSDLIKKMSNLYWILPFYDYAYESVKVLRSLCHDTRNLWINNQNAIIRMLEKQIIYIENSHLFDEKTIATLKRECKYKLFKLDIEISIWNIL